MYMYIHNIYIYIYIYIYIVLWPGWLARRPFSPAPAGKDDRSNADLRPDHRWRDPGPRGRGCRRDRLHQVPGRTREGGMMRLETLIELK